MNKEDEYKKIEVFGKQTIYGSKKSRYEGLVFDSKAEAKRYIDLLDLQELGVIRDLHRQVKFNLVPAQYKDGKLVEKPVDYYADFVYYTTGDNGKQVVEDVKGKKTEVYIVKRKLMLYRYDIRILET